MTNLEVWQIVDSKGWEDAIFEGYLNPADIEDRELKGLVDLFQSYYKEWRRMQDIVDNAYYDADAG